MKTFTSFSHTQKYGFQWVLLENSLQVSSHLTLTETYWGRWYYQARLTKAETISQRVRLSAQKQARGSIHPGHRVTQCRTSSCAGRPPAGSRCALPRPTGWPAGKPRPSRLGPQIDQLRDLPLGPILVHGVEIKLVFRTILGLRINKWQDCPKEHIKVLQITYSQRSVPNLFWHRGPVCMLAHRSSPAVQPSS